MTFSLPQLATVVLAVLATSAGTAGVCWLLWRAGRGGPAPATLPTPAQAAEEQREVAAVQTGQGATVVDLDKVLGRKP